MAQSISLLTRVQVKVIKWFHRRLYLRKQISSLQIPFSSAHCKPTSKALIASCAVTCGVFAITWSSSSWFFLLVDLLIRLSEVSIYMLIYGMKQCSAVWRKNIAVMHLFSVVSSSSDGWSCWSRSNNAFWEKLWSFNHFLIFDTKHSSNRYLKIFCYPRHFLSILVYK